jgi:YD repeat-containing protein
MRPSHSQFNKSLAGQTNALGQTTGYTYNSSGEQTATTDTLGHPTSYAYDSNRRLSTMTDAQGDVTSYTYDDANGKPANNGRSAGQVVESAGQGWVGEA